MLLWICITVPLCFSAWMGPEPLASLAMYAIRQIVTWGIGLLVLLFLLRLLITLIHGFHE